MLAGIISVFLALIFLAAAWHKFQGLPEFSGVLRNYQILPEWSVGGVARLLPIVELTLALCLLAGFMLSLMTYLAFVMLMVFTVAIALNILRGRTYIDCGCFRPESAQHLSWWMVLRNISLASAAWYAGGVHAVHNNNADMLAIYPAAIGFAILYFASSTLSVLANSARQRQRSR
jgi:hypothetical protein